jgi:hypothetical protein
VAAESQPREGRLLISTADNGCGAMTTQLGVFATSLTSFLATAELAFDPSL